MNGIDPDKLIGRYRYEVEPFQEDVSGALSWGIMGNTLLRCANLQAATTGFGYDDMIRRGHVWVLARLAVEIDHMPRTAEAYTVETWFAGYFRQFSNRAYTITDSQGREIGRAVTVWSLIDTESRRPADLATFAGATFDRSIVHRHPGIEPGGRIKVNAVEAASTLTARFTDLDINGHVNSIRYLEHSIDLLPLAYHSKHRLHRVDMAFSAETYHGEQMHLYHDQAPDQSHTVDIRKATAEAQETVCKIRMQFMPVIQ